MTLLAALASFALPGAGVLLLRRWLPGAIWFLAVLGGYFTPLPRLGVLLHVLSMGHSVYVARRAYGAPTQAASLTALIVLLSMYLVLCWLGVLAPLLPDSPPNA